MIQSFAEHPGSAGPHTSTKQLAAEIDRRVQGLPLRNAPNIDRLRMAISKALREKPGEYVLGVAEILAQTYGYRSGISYELVKYHPEASRLLDEQALLRLGRGIASWGMTDSFARHLSGPAWLRGQIEDSVIHGWARSPDRWWRRAALVSTVALNAKVDGGEGDPRRTIAVCKILLEDRDDMVVKAFSWALRELVPRDPAAVEAFLGQDMAVLAARVKREVRNKLETGLKNPRRGKQAA